MAASPTPTGYEPKLLDKNISVDDDMTPINDPDHDSISDLSRTTRQGTRLFCDPTMCENTYVSHVSCGNVALPKESQPRETVRGQREREEREGSVISVGRVDVKEKSTKTVEGVILIRLAREFYSDERDLREHLERRSSTRSSW